MPWTDGIDGKGKVLGPHEQAQLIQKSGDSNPEGLRNVMRHAGGSDYTEFSLEESWHSGPDVDDKRGPMGIVNIPYTGGVRPGSVSTQENIPNTKQRWDRNPG